MIMKRATAPRTLARRLLPLQIGMALQGLILWVPIEKLFMTQIGFDAASVGAMAAAYAAVVPLLEVPSGILADRWSRSRLMVLACVALVVSSLMGGLSQNVIGYVNCGDDSRGLLRIQLGNCRQHRLRRCGRGNRLK
jgi:MFS family permease